MNNLEKTFRMKKITETLEYLMQHVQDSYQKGLTPITLLNAVVMDDPDNQTSNNLLVAYSGSVSELKEIIRELVQKIDSDHPGFKEELIEFITEEEDISKLRNVSTANDIPI